MPKLLSCEEVIKIATMMTAEYGLPPPEISYDEIYNGYNHQDAVRMKVFRFVKSKKLFWFKASKISLIEIQNSCYEDILISLRHFLSEFDSQAKTAESFREKYTKQEADQVLDTVLSEK